LGWLNIAPKSAGMVSAVPSAEDLRDLEGVVDVEINLEVGDEVTTSHPSVWGVLLTVGADSIADFNERAVMLNDRVQIGVAAHV
jgi:hypothetical protein